MNTLPRTPPKILLAGWLIVLNVIGWLSNMVILTEQDFQEAGVDLGERHE